MPTASDWASGLLPRALCKIVSCAMRQVIYSRNGVNITATPVEHYTTGGPSALRVDWNGLSFVYSGGRTPPMPARAFCRIGSTPPVVTQRVCLVETLIVKQGLVQLVGDCVLCKKLSVGLMCSQHFAQSNLVHWVTSAEGVTGAAVHCRRYPPHAHAQ